MANHPSLSDKMTIRLANNEQDFALLRPVSLELHAESRFADIPYSFAKRDKLFRQAIDSPQTHALIIVEYKQQPIGFLFCAIGEYMVGTDVLLTTVYSFYVRQHYRSNAIGGRTAIRLLSAAIKWSQARNSTFYGKHALTLLAPITPSSFNYIPLHEQLHQPTTQTTRHRQAASNVFVFRGTGQEITATTNRLLF